MGAAALAKCEVCTTCSQAVGGEWDPTGRPVPAPAFESMFDGIDKNGDGQLNREEWRSAFDLLDVDRSGAISRSEWEAQLGQTHMFDLIDHDGGGNITLEEWNNAFDIFDRNRDGLIDTGDWEAASLKPKKAASSRPGSRRPGASSATSRVASNRPIMESCVMPCPSAYVLRVAVEESFDNSRDSSEARELLLAASRGNFEVASRLLEGTRCHGWRFCTDQAGDSALHLAARNGHLQVVGLLLRHKAVLDTRNLRGEVPLHDACNGGFAEIVETLCAAEADPRMGELRSNEVPGLYAVRRHADWLQSDAAARSSSPPQTKPRVGGASPPKQFRERRFVCIKACLESMQRWDPKAPAAASLINSQGITGLHIAAGASDLDVCRLLLSFDANADAPDALEGGTPLMFGLRAGATAAIAELLLRSKADHGRRDRAGGSPLHYAAAAGDDGILSVDLLISARADVDAVDERGANALALAGLRGAPGTVRRLLAAGARPTGMRGVLHHMPEDARAPDRRSCREILEAVSVFSGAAGAK